MSTDAATHARNEQTRQMLDRARRVFKPLGPVNYANLGPLDPANFPVDAEIQAVAPHLGNRVTLHGYLGDPVTSRDLLTPTGTPFDFEILPLLLVWPYSIPVCNGVSLLDHPIVTLSAGDYVYLRVNWTIRQGFMLDSDACQIVFSRANDLASQNNADGITNPPTGTVTKTWHHRLGVITSTGTFTPDSFTSPFIPPSLT